MGCRSNIIIGLVASPIFSWKYLRPQVCRNQPAIVYPVRWVSIRRTFVNLISDLIFILIFNWWGGGGIDYVHPFLIINSKFLEFFCMVKYNQISEFTGVSKGLVSPRYPWKFLIFAVKIFLKKCGHIQPPPLTHPFYPILLPNTPYVKFLFFFILFVGGPKSKKKIMISKNNFN